MTLILVQAVAVALAVVSANPYVVLVACLGFTVVVFQYTERRWPGDGSTRDDS